ncbi:uncharacterized protein LOC143021869 [Oratosquilla oratoria]|uniref:uncharacterized protein LOC143021869 n=1 Tax=Oratosquilla oratoria TaxID=337810 RepID=UPI003F771652
MESQVHYHLSHFISPSVDVASYHTLQQGPTPTFTAFAPSHTNIAVTDDVASSGTPAALAVSYSHPNPEFSVQPYTTVLSNVTVASTPQVAINPQYFYNALNHTTHQGHVPQAQENPKFTTVVYSQFPMASVGHVTSTGTDLTTDIVGVRHKPNRSAEKVLVNDTTKEVNSSRKQRKLLRNQGKAYINASGKLVEEKCYIDKDCNCKANCISRLGDFEFRKDIFTKFWDIGDFSKQNAYLAESIILVPNKLRKWKESRKEEKSTKTVTRLYYVKKKESKVRVCKNMFLSLHGVSNGRLDRVLQAVHCDAPYALQDRRGHHTPGNKTTAEDVDFVCSHILSISHSGSQQPQCLPSDSVANAPPEYPHLMNTTSGKELSVRKMYELYKEKCALVGRNPVSAWMYRNIYKTQNEKPSTRSGMLQAYPDEYGKENDVVDNNQNDEDADKDGDKTESHTKPKFKQKKSTTEVKGTMTRKERKVLRNKGEAYVTPSGKLVSRKVFKDKHCGCKYKCIPSVILPEDREKIFRGFWELGDFNAQNMYIAENVKLFPIRARNRCSIESEKFSKTNMRIYQVYSKSKNGTVRVCKTAFLQLHGVSNGRLDRVLQAVACGAPHALKDRRGHHTPKNKTSISDVEHASQFIENLLQQQQQCYSIQQAQHQQDHTLVTTVAQALCTKSSSHNTNSQVPQSVNTIKLSDVSNPTHAVSTRRTKSAQTRTGQQCMSVEKMFHMYKNNFLQEGKKSVSKFVFRRMMRERFRPTKQL